MEVQIFGIKKSSATRKAERFFKERRVKIHFVDLDTRVIAKGELERFSQKAGGLSNLLDKNSKTYLKLGLEYMKLSEERWLETVQAHPELLPLPLVRFGKYTSTGDEESTWKTWIASVT